MKIFVNNRRSAGDLFSFKTLQYWANAYSFRSMELDKVFCRKKASKMSKIKLLNGYLTLKGFEFVCSFVIFLIDHFV